MWQKCPICNGVGQVSGGYFTRAGDSPFWMSGSTLEPCLRCDGTGLLSCETGKPPKRARNIKKGKA